MASIYERVLLYKVLKAWGDNKPTLSKVYKLQSNNLQNKSWVEIHKDNGKYGIKFTINKMVPEFNKGAEKCDLNWSDSFVEFENFLQGHHRTARKQVLHEDFQEPVNAMVPVLVTQDYNLEENFHQATQLFIQWTLNEKKPRDRQYIYLQPGGDHVFQKSMMQTPVNHLQHFEEMIRTAEALPARGMQPPNKVLQLEWFYMSFHSEDHAKYVESGQCLCDEMLESDAEYFKNIFNLQVADGSLAKKCKRQIKHRVRREMRQALRRGYNKKVHRIMEQHHRSGGRHSRQSNTYHHHNYKWKNCNHSGHCHNCNKHKKKQEDKTPSDCGNKAFKPCSIHGPKSNHTSKESYKNPKNQTSIKPMTKNVNTRRITTMRIKQVMMMSRPLVLIRWSQVKIRHQPQARAKTMRMRNIIYC